MYGLIVEGLADGILGVKHGVDAFVIQALECYNNAGTCCYQVDIILVGCDSATLRIVQFRFSGSSFRLKQKNVYCLEWSFCLIAGRSLVGDRT